MYFTITSIVTQNLDPVLRVAHKVKELNLCNGIFTVSINVKLLTIVNVIRLFLFDFHDGGRMAF